MNTLKLTIVEPAQERNLTADAVMDLVRQRLLQIPGYGQRPLPVPLGLHHPEWVSCDVDLDAHIHRLRIDSPGGRPELDRAVATASATLLARDRPLWELWVFDGLADGRIAVLHKIHHALADGAAAANQLAALAFPGGPQALGIVPPVTPRDIERSRLALLRTALRDRLRQLSTLGTLVRETAAARRALRELDARSPSDAVSLIGGSPATLFRGRLTSERSFGTGRLSLDQALRVKNAFGVSLNDVLLSIAGTALKSYLAGTGQPINDSLTAGIPMSTDNSHNDNDGPRLFGNHWSMGVTTLATDIADPAEQLHRISDAMTAVKARHRITGNLLETWADHTYGPLTSALAAAASRWGLLPRLPLPNMIVSNVRGPDAELDIGEGRVSEFYSVGPLSEGIGINLTAWSFAGSLNVAVISCASMLPEPSMLIEHMRAALNGLDENAETDINVAEGGG